MTGQLQLGTAAGLMTMTQWRSHKVPLNLAEVTEAYQDVYRLKLFSLYFSGNSEKWRCGQVSVF